MSREVLGGLIGRNARWVKAVERGEIGQPKLPTLLNLAEALRLRDVGRLTGGEPLPMRMFRGPGHPALNDVRDAINAVAVSMTGPPSPLEHLQARLDAWDVWGRGAGEGGVTDDRERAIRHVHEALRGLETGASGKVRHVALAPDGTAAYIDLRTVGEAWRDAITGTVIWRAE